MPEIPKGYKQTEVGVIPEEWGAKWLGELASVSAGGTPSRANEQYWGGSIPWVTTSEVDFNTITHAEQSITKKGLDSSAAKLLRRGTLLMALYGQGKTRGKVGILGIEAATNQACASIATSRDVLPDYLFFFLACHYEDIRKLSNTGNQENLNGNLVRSIPIAVPPLPEQEAIAAALSDADAWIESLEKLIEKRRAVKQGAMQALLTPPGQPGHQRLPGFTGAWEAKRLDELCMMKSGEGITAKSIDDASEYPCYGGNGLRGFTSRFSHEGTYCLIGRVGALCGNLLQVAGRFFATEHAIVVTAFENVDIGWLTRALGTLRLNRRAESSAQPVLTVSKLRTLELFAPADKNEQSAIAAVLSDLDAEVEALEAKLAKARQIKQGMMQELLTGRVRLV